MNIVLQVLRVIFPLAESPEEGSIPSTLSRRVSAHAVDHQSCGFRPPLLVCGPSAQGVP